MGFSKPGTYLAGQLSPAQLQMSRDMSIQDIGQDISVKQTLNSALYLEL